MTGYDSFPYIVKTLSAFAVVIGLMVIVVHLMKRFMARTAGVSGGTGIKIVAARYLGPKMSVMLLDVMGTYLVVGSTPQQISLLTTLDNPDAIEKITALTREADPSGTFREQLRKYTSKRAFSRAPQDKP